MILSEVKKKKASESPTTSTSVQERETRFTKSPKEPSPLLQLVPGSKRRARLNKEKAEKNKSGDMKSMFEPNFNLLYTTSDIEKSKFNSTSSFNGFTSCKS